MPNFISVTECLKQQIVQFMGKLSNIACNISQIS